MNDYLIIESRDASESPDVQFTTDLAADLARQGKRVTILLVQNGVMPARKGARAKEILTAGDAGVRLLADRFSLRERGIASDELQDGISPSPLEAVIDSLAAGHNVIWH